MIKSVKDMKIGNNYFRVRVSEAEIDITHHKGLEKIDKDVLTFHGTQWNNIFYSINYSIDWFLNGTEHCKVVGIANNWKDALKLMKRARKELLVREIIE
jgi:hypothetical protein